MLTEYIFYNFNSRSFAYRRKTPVPKSTVATQCLQLCFGITATHYARGV